jgi:type IX secretion system substrate protein
MKNLYFLILYIFISNTAHTQINNPSFEENGNPTLEFWSGLCNLATSENEGAPNNGDWSLNLQAGNTQGCITSEYYQILPDVNSGDHVMLTGWMKSSGLITASIGIGTIDPEGNLNTLSKDTTSNVEWIQRTVETDVILGTGESAVVILNSGLTAGPIGGPDYYGLYDGLELSINTAVSENLDKRSITLFPNPVTHDLLKIKTSLPPEDFVSVSIFNCLGKKVQHYLTYQENFDLHCLPKGIYFIEIKTTKGSLVKTLILDKP